MVDFKNIEGPDKAISTGDFIRQALGEIRRKRESGVANTEKGTRLPEEPVAGGTKEIVGIDVPIESYNSGQPMGSAVEDLPRVEVSEVTPAEQKEQEQPAPVVTEAGVEIPTEVQQVDRDLATVVEGAIEKEGGNVAEVVAEVGTKTEIPPSDKSLTATHNAFIGNPNDADAENAAGVEEIWDPLEKNEAT